MKFNREAKDLFPQVKEPILVVLSGGQDSSTCLGLARAVNPETDIHTVSFRYGQRHQCELQNIEYLGDRFTTLSSTTVDIPDMAKVSTSALISEEMDVGAEHPDHPNLPASFVPNRNMLFLTLAHGLAQKIGAKWLVAGFCQTDYSGYPDCRAEFASAAIQALNIGSVSKIGLITPLMYLTKAETFAIADKFGFLRSILERTHTCYEGGRMPHAWGRGCGHCPACKLRRKGYNEYLETFKQ